MTSCSQTNTALTKCFCQFDITRLENNIKSIFSPLFISDYYFEIRTEIDIFVEELPQDKFKLADEFRTNIFKELKIAEDFCISRFRTLEPTCPDLSSCFCEFGDFKEISRLYNLYNDCIQQVLGTLFVFKGSNLYALNFATIDLCSAIKKSPVKDFRHFDQFANFYKQVVDNQFEYDWFWSDSIYLYEDSKSFEFVKQVKLKNRFEVSNIDFETFLQSSFQHQTIECLDQFKVEEDDKTKFCSTEVKPHVQVLDLNFVIPTFKWFPNLTRVNVPVNSQKQFNSLCLAKLKDLKLYNTGRDMIKFPRNFVCVPKIQLVGNFFISNLVPFDLSTCLSGLFENTTFSVAQIIVPPGNSKLAIYKHNSKESRDFRYYNQDAVFRFCETNVKTIVGIGNVDSVEKLENTSCLNNFEYSTHESVFKISKRQDDVQVSNIYFEQIFTRSFDNLDELSCVGCNISDPSIFQFMQGRSFINLAANKIQDYSKGPICKNTILNNNLLKTFDRKILNRINLSGNLLIEVYILSDLPSMLEVDVSRNKLVKFSLFQSCDYLICSYNQLKEFNIFGYYDFVIVSHNPELSSISSTPYAIKEFEFFDTKINMNENHGTDLPTCVKCGYQLEYPRLENLYLIRSKFSKDIYPLEPENEDVQKTKDKTRENICKLESLKLKYCEILSMPKFTKIVCLFLNDCGLEEFTLNLPTTITMLNLKNNNIKTFILQNVNKMQCINLEYNNITKFIAPPCDQLILDNNSKLVLRWIPSVSKLYASNIKQFGLENLGKVRWLYLDTTPILNPEILINHQFETVSLKNQNLSFRFLNKICKSTKDLFICDLFSKSLFAY